MKILIVDDSKVARMLITSILNNYRNDVELIEAENGKVALELFTSENPDITFLDLTMPVMGGLEALELMKREDQNATVVVLTADVQQQSVDRCMERGAYTVLKKLPTEKVIFQLIDEIQVQNKGGA